MASWKATGLVRPIWERYAKERGVSNGRDMLAEAIGTAGTTLSSLEHGKKPMTSEMARRIAGEARVSVLELGAPEDEADDEGRLILEEVRDLRQAVSELDARIRQFEEPDRSPPEAGEVQEGAG